MSWPSTDFECEIQDELDELRARNKLLEAIAAAARSVYVYHTHLATCGCEICKSFAALDLAEKAKEEEEL